MKTPKRFPPLLAAALLLGTSVVTLPGCAKEAPQDARREPMTVIVLIEYDDSTGTTSWTSSQGLPNKLVKLSKKYQDTVQWVAPAGLVEVDNWSPAMPFDQAPKHEKKVLKSKPPKEGTVGHGYNYDAWLVLPDGTRKKIDPRIEVME